MATVAKEVLNSKENYTEKYGFSMPESYVYKADKGLSEEVVRKISQIKNEPQWMTDFRIRSLKLFLGKPMPKWGANLTGIDFNAITYYLKATDTKSKSWEDVPENIKKTFDRLGIPEAEKKFLAGAGAQYDSEVIYHQIREDLEKQGVIFKDMDSGLKEHEDLVKKYFGTVIPPEDNKFAALNSAVWSGGSMVYVPKGVHVEMPLQAYFRINAKNMGQFERTLIIAEPGSSIHYIEGCFTKGASIRTAEGTKKIEDIKEDDIVLTHSGSYKKVYKTMKRKHNGTLCTIKFSNNPKHELKITGGHPILAVEKETINQKNWKPKWIEAGQLDNFDYIAMPITEFSKMAGQLNLTLSADDLMLQQKIILYANKICSYAFVPIKYIEKEIVTDLDVYNFSVEEDESYVANGIVVHNCTAPSYSSDSLHSAVVELIAMEGSKIQYTTIQNWSSNVYNLVTKRAFAYKNAEVFWVDGNLGCLAEGTKIATNPGLQEIEKIEPGQKVITLNEETHQLEPRIVLGTKFSGIKYTYNVVLENGKREVIATNSHPFLTVEYDKNKPKKLGRYKFVWKPLEALEKGSFIMVPKELPDLGKPYELKKPTIDRQIIGRNQHGATYTIDTSYKYIKLKMPDATTDDLLWLFGVFIGDGNIEIAKHKKSGANRFGKVIFSVPKNDLAREKVIEVMKSAFGLDKYTERKDGVTITYNSLVLAEFFKLNSLSGVAHTKRLPEWIFSLPLSQKKALLAGYIESDGLIRKNNARFKTCNKYLLEDIKTLAMGCGIEVNRIKEEKETKTINVNGYNGKEKEYTCYVMHISNLSTLRKHFSQKNREKIPVDAHEHNTYWFTGAKKGRRIKMPNHLALQKITDIIPCGEKPTYDLEIEGSHNFIANGVLVHNSKVTMKFPAVWLLGEGARGEVLSVAFAGAGQHQDAGAKILHFAPNTSSVITNKSISKDGGKTTYRGLVKVAKGATNVKSNVVCDALILDDKSSSDTVPYMELEEKDIQISHEATVGKINEDQLFYLMSRGMSEREAMAMIVRGFIERFTKTLPMEYAIELNRLVELEMEGSVG